MPKVEAEILANEYREQHPDMIFDQRQNALIVDLMTFVATEVVPRIKLEWVNETLDGMAKAGKQRADEWIVRFDHLNHVLGNCTVPFLKICLTEATSLKWNDAKSDELMLAADAIITGSDDVKKAKLIAAARRLKPEIIS